MSLAPSQKEFSCVQHLDSFNELLPVVSTLLEDMVVDPLASSDSRSKASTVSGGSSLGHSSSGSICSTDSRHSVFDGTREGPMSIQDYLIRLVKYSHCSKETFIVFVIYLDRFNSATNRELTTRNIHRLLLSSFVVAAKLRDDVYYSNSYYAVVGGVSLKDLNTMERQFLSCLHWDLYVDSNEYDKYVASLAQVKRRRAAKERSDGYSSSRTPSRHPRVQRTHPPQNPPEPPMPLPATGCGAGAPGALLGKDRQPCKK